MKCSVDIWNVGIKAGTLQSLDELEHIASHIEWLPVLSKYQYIADPFIVQTESEIRILVEHYDYFRKWGPKGEIHEWNPKTKCLSPIIQYSEHLSYPYVFHDNDQTWVVPEAADAHKCMAYPRTSSGKIGDPVCLFQNRDIVDPTLFIWDKRYWLLFSDKQYQPSGSTGSLFAYYADRLAGPWHPHQQNPIKTGVRGSRPAGMPFVFQNNLYRPAQNCLHDYGQSLILYKVHTLYPKTFIEEEVYEILPCSDSAYPQGLHHLHVTPNLIAIDAKYKYKDWLYPIKDGWYQCCRLFKRP
jgi:hypothetical protein